MATAVSFSDDPLTPGTTKVTTSHFTELRQAVAAVRTLGGLPSPAWSESIVPRVTVIQSGHLQELRDRLNEALSALGLPLPGYTESMLSPRASLIRAIHLADLRRAVQ